VGPGVLEDTNALDPPLCLIASSDASEKACKILQAANKRKPYEADAKVHLTEGPSKSEWIYVRKGEAKIQVVSQQHLYLSQESATSFKTIRNAALGSSLVKK